MKFLMELFYQLIEKKKYWFKNLVYKAIQKKWIKRYLKHFPNNCFVLTLRRNSILAAYGLENKVDSYFGTLLIDSNAYASLRQKNGKVYIDYSQSDIDLKPLLIENDLKESELCYLIEEFYNKDLKIYNYFCQKDDILQF